MGFDIQVQLVITAPTIRCLRLRYSLVGLHALKAIKATRDSGAMHDKRAW